MALNLARIAAPTGAETARLKPMKVKGPVIPKTYTSHPAAATTPTHSPFDQFLLADPFAHPQQLATSSFNADVANDQKLAGMGVPTTAQTTADYAARGAAANTAYQSLQQQLAGIQTANVAQGNAGAASLAGQTAGLGAPQGVQAVLGANTAATGNYGGSLQAAALSAGTQANTQAINAGAVADQTNRQGIAKTLASLLANEKSVSDRTTDYQTANQQVDAANKQTLLSIYQGDKQAETAAAALGDKDQQAAYARQSARDLALLTQKGEDYRTTLTTNAANGRSAAQIAAADRRAANSDQTKRDLAAQKRTFDAAQAKLKRGAALNLAEKKALLANSKAKGGIKNYYVTALMPASSVVDPNTGKLTQKPAYRKVLHVSSKVWDAFNTSGPAGQRKLSVLGVPEGTKIQASTGY